MGIERTRMGGLGLFAGFSFCILVAGHADAGVIAPTTTFPTESATVAAEAMAATCANNQQTEFDDQVCPEFNAGNFGEGDFSQTSPAHQQALSESQRQAQRETRNALSGPNGRTAFVRSAAREGRASGFALNGRPFTSDDQQFAEAPLISSDALAQGDAGAGGLGGRLGAFVNVKYGFGDQDENGFEAGFDYDIIGVLGGVDYRFTDQFVAGVAFGYNRTAADYKGFASGSEFDTDNFSGSLYGSYYPTDAVYFDFLATYGFNDFSTERQLGGPINQTAEGEADGDQYGLSATAGYQLTRQMLSFGPYAQVNWQQAEVDGYTETGSVLALTVEEQTLKSLSSVLGVRADYAISTGLGVLVPTLRVEWEHEFSNDSRVIVGEFATDPGALMNLATVDPDRNFFNVGVGMAATLPRGATAFVDYEILLGHEDLTNHVITVGARLEF